MDFLVGDSSGRDFYDFLADGFFFLSESMTSIISLTFEVFFVVKSSIYFYVECCPISFYVDRFSIYFDVDPRPISFDLDRLSISFDVDYFSDLILEDYLPPVDVTI